MTEAEKLEFEIREKTRQLAALRRPERLDDGGENLRD